MSSCPVSSSSSTTAGGSSTETVSCSCVSESAAPNTELRSTLGVASDSSSTTTGSCDCAAVPKIPSTPTDVPRGDFCSAGGSAVSVSLLPNTALKSTSDESDVAASSLSAGSSGSEDESPPNIVPGSVVSVVVSSAVSLLKTPESGFSPPGTVSPSDEPPNIEAKSTAGFSCFFSSSRLIPMESRRSSTPGTSFLSPMPMVFSSSSIPSEESRANTSSPTAESANTCCPSLRPPFASEGEDISEILSRRERETFAP